MKVESGNRRLQLWVGIVISALCLIAIFLIIDPGEIWRALQNAQPGYLLLGVAGILGFMLVRAVRWRFMLGNVVPLGKVFHIQNIGYMLTFLLPFRLGDVARAIIIGNVPPVTLPQGISTMLVERLLDLLLVLTILPFTLRAVPALPEQVSNAVIALSVVGLAAMVILVIAANQRERARMLTRAILNRLPMFDTERWVKRVDDLLLGLGTLTSLRAGLWLVVLSILVWLPILFAYYMTLRGVGIEPTWVMAGFIVCVAALSVAAPSSPGQIGVFHASVIFGLVEILGQPAAESASFAFIYHALNFLTLVVLGVIGVWRTGDTFGDIISTTRDFMRRKDTQSSTFSGGE
jgi:uncharacterized protein (TIRG00374 family)